MAGPALPHNSVRSVNTSLMLRVFYAFVVLVLFSIAISIGGKLVGGSIAMGGHSDSTKMHEIVIGNNVLAVPANMIRFEGGRHDGDAARIDLYMRWPDMEGYSTATRDDFNNIGGERRILFVSIEEQAMSRDMSGRYLPIYSSLVRQPGKPGPAGTVFYDFTEKSGYLNEVLAVAARPGMDPFVARCLTGANAAESLAPCERDIHIGTHLSMTYRFPRELLGEWPALDRAVAAKAAEMLKTGGS